MKIQTLLSTLVIAASLSVPLLVSNTATAGERGYGDDYRSNNYAHGYRDGYRDGSDDERHYSRRSHDYGYNYAPPVVVGHGYNYGGGHGYRRHGGGHRSGIDLIFRF